MSILITDPMQSIGLLLLIGFCIFLIILVIMDMRDIKNISLEEAYKLKRRSNEYKPVIAAVITINIFAWTIGKSSLEEKISSTTLFYVLSGMDLFVILFTIGILIRTSLARKRINILEEQSDKK